MMFARPCADNDPGFECELLSNTTGHPRCAEYSATAARINSLTFLPSDVAHAFTAA
jgi:hypothetical protein